MTVESTISIPQLRTKYFSEVEPLNIPSFGDDAKWRLYLVFEARSTFWKTDWSPESTSISVLRVHHDPALASASSGYIRDGFEKLPLEARNTWNKFVNEMEQRPEMKGRLIIVQLCTPMSSSKFVARISSVAAGPSKAKY